jgi:hypothetical protein
MIVSFWLAVILMTRTVYDPTGDIRNEVSALTKVPFTTDEECYEDVRRFGIDVFNEQFKPLGWQMAEVYCVPVTEQFSFDPLGANT